MSQQAQTTGRDDHQHQEGGNRLAPVRDGIKEIEGLMAAGKGTPEGDRLDMLATLVEAYEMGLWGY